MRAELESANAAVRALEAERREKERAAVSAVQAEYSERMAAASKRRADAERAMRNHIDATASHPWDGKRVFKMESEPTRGWQEPGPKTVRVDGIVEVVRQSSKFPDNMNWSRPSLGHVIVRKVRKDGSASLQTHRAWGDIMKEWTLAE